MNISASLMVGDDILQQGCKFYNPCHACSRCTHANWVVDFTTRFALFLTVSQSTSEGAKDTDKKLMELARCLASLFGGRQKHMHMHSGCKYNPCWAFLTISTSLGSEMAVSLQPTLHIVTCSCHLGCSESCYEWIVELPTSSLKLSTLMTSE